MTNLKISNRLKSIGNLINDNTNIVDVGCDHGLLSIYICLNKKNVNIIASDINKLPLESATFNIKKYKLQNKIKTILSNGLENINTYFDTVIISGLGGTIIVDILKKDKIKLKSVKNIIVSPQNNLYFVRKEINKLGFNIENEILIKDNSIIYTIIKFTKGKKHYSYKELTIGPILLKNKSNLFIELNTNKLNKYINIKNKVPKKYIIKHFLLNKKVNVLKKEI